MADQLNSSRSGSAADEGCACPHPEGAHYAAFGCYYCECPYVPPRASQPSSSSEIPELTVLLDEIEATDWEPNASIRARHATARSRLESLYREQLQEIERREEALEMFREEQKRDKQEIERLRAFEGPGYQYAGNHIPRAAIECRNEEIRELYARLSSLKDSQLTDTARLDWLDTMGTFGVALNRHDGRQKTQDENGRPVILRLWLKDRGGENQSLREAIDALRPEVEK